MKKSILLVSVLAITSAANAADVKMSLNDGHGTLTGVTTSQNKFRISDIQEVGPREVKISGDLFAGESTKEILGDCQDVYSMSPRTLAKNKKSIFLSTKLYPYTKEGLSQIVGVEAETAPSLVKLTPVLRIGKDSYTRRAYPILDTEALTQKLFGKEVVNQESVSRGEEIKLDLTGYGPLVCDILTGSAELTWKAQVTFPQPAPQVFIPVSGQEIEALSKVLLTRYQFNGTALKNVIAVTSAVETELQSLRNITINKVSNDSKALFWTKLTLSDLVAGIIDEKTGKPQFMNAEKAQALEASLTVTAYQYESRELLFNAQIVGAK